MKSREPFPFYTPKEIMAIEDTFIRGVVIASIVFYMAVGLVFAIAFLVKGAGLLSIIPFLGLTIMAWERKS
jgi:4-amino-4-deoxy-L-arabinose transferase-like glycosyltransferase